MTFTATASLPKHSSQARSSNGEPRSSMLTGANTAATPTSPGPTTTSLLVPVALPALPGGVTQARPDTGLERKLSTANHRIPPPQDSSLPNPGESRSVGPNTDMDTGKDESQSRTDKEAINKSDFDTDGTPIDWTEMEVDPSTALLPQPESFNGWSNKTGYVYDVRMKHHNNVHGDDDHPEDPRRIWRIYDAIRNAHCTDRMIKITSREATVDELGLVHTDNHIENITKTSAMSKDDLLEMANSYNSIYLNNLSAFCARLSCGSLIEICKAVASGQVLNGVAIIRPPGHHAEPHEAGGFCLYNNVAIAARYLQQNHGLKKIFILDWDVHHGNGTQTAFIDDPDVVYCSIHRFDHGTFYPGDPVAAAHTTVGEGLGRGRTINIPWNSSGMGDSEYIYAFNKVIMPILYEFAPDFVLVSAGFDAAKGDHIGQMLVTPAAYGHMTHMLKSLAGGKIILALEGGYNLDSIAVSGLACVKALLNDPIEALDPIRPNPLCVQTIHEVIKVQSRYWKSLPPIYANAEDDIPTDTPAIGMDKILAVYQENHLRETYGMIKMPRLDGKDRGEFLDNVHCTQQLYNNNPLYIFIHDLGELCARTVGTNNTLRPQKSVLVDAMTQYVDYIINAGNELIDVVVPYLPTTEEEKVMLKDQQSNVLADLWSTLVATSAMEGRRIVVLATGFGCHGLVAFLNEKQKEVPRYLSSVTLVLGDDTMPMNLSPWYIENSFVMASDDHPIWERTSQKMNSRTGNLLRTERPLERLAETLLYLRKRIFSDIESKLESLAPFPSSDSESDTKLEEAVPMELEFPPMQTRSGRLSMQMERVSKSEASTPERQRQASSPQMQSSAANLLTVAKNGTRRGRQPNSRPGSPLLNGSIPGSVPSLVERPTVLGPQRTHPYPQGNSRDSGPPSLNSSPRSTAA
ncbi:Histone deacetylase hda1, partial [Linnemannia elongata]